MEKEIIALLKSKGMARMGFGHNVEITSEFDEDGDEYPIIVNAVEITGSRLIAYDSNDEDENGEYDPYWEVSELPEDTQKEILWALSTFPWDVWNWEAYNTPVDEDELSAESKSYLETALNTLQLAYNHAEGNDTAMEEISTAMDIIQNLI